MQLYTCLLKHTFCLIITKWDTVLSIVPITPFSSARTEKNGHVHLGKLSNHSLFTWEVKPKRSCESTKPFIFSGFSNCWSEGIYMVGRHIFPWRCAFFNSCQIQGGTYWKKSSLWVGFSLKILVCPEWKISIIASLTFTIPTGLKSCSIEHL